MAKQLRCPYCKELFPPQEKCRCPHCDRFVNIPRTARPSYEKNKIRNKTSEAERRARFGNADQQGPFAGKNSRQLLILGGMTLFVIIALVVAKAPEEMERQKQERDKAYAEAAAKPDLRTIRANQLLVTYRKALELFHEDIGRYPTQKEGLRALIEDPLTLSWKGPYLHPQTIYGDPWYNLFLYDVVDGKVMLMSKGPDGKKGTADDLHAPAEVSTEGLDRSKPKLEVSSTLADTLKEKDPEAANKDAPDDEQPTEPAADTSEPETPAAE